MIALYLAQVASDNYERLGEKIHAWRLPLTFGRLLYIRYSPFRMTALSTLLMNLKPVKREARSRLELDSVPGVDWNKLFDMNGFSELHKIVYGVSSRPLDAEIDARPEDLDRLDNVGLTALWWACWFGNSNYVRILIQHGADVNNGSVTPIWAAVRRGSYDSVKQVLDAGASITDRSMGRLYETLMYLSICMGEEHVKEVLAIDKALFGHLFSVDHRSSIHGQDPPLIALARQTSPVSHARISQLLEFGADTELADEWGLTPLCHAISADNTEGCTILGRAGANANVKTNVGRTILHLAIENATDASIIQAVSELDLFGVELGAKDNSGRTAFELLEFRARRHRNDRHLFPTLLCDDDCDGFGLFWVEDIDTELKILFSFQNLLQQVQEVQRVPIEDRYPLLSPTPESIMAEQRKDRSSETIIPSIPGAWPEN